MGPLIKSHTCFNPDSLITTPMKSEKNRGAATGKSRQRITHMTTANDILVAALYCLGAFFAGFILMARKRLGTPDTGIPRT